MQSVESVLMDALKYAHHILIEKINHWKQMQQMMDRQRIVERQQELDRQQQDREHGTAGQSSRNTNGAGLVTAGVSRVVNATDYCDNSSPQVSCQTTLSNQPPSHSVYFVCVLPKYCNSHSRVLI